MKPPILWGLEALRMTRAAFEAAEDACDDDKPEQGRLALDTGREHLRHARECYRQHRYEPPTEKGERQQLAELALGLLEAAELENNARLALEDAQERKAQHAQT